MKKFTIMFLFFLLLAFSINTISTVAQPNTQTFSEGFYSISDLKLLPNVAYNVQNVSPVETFVIIFDGDKKIQQSIRLEGNSIKYAMKPMKNDYRFIIFGSGKLAFTPTNITP